MRDRIKTALWGLGRHARKRILAALKDAASVELVGICTRDKEAGNREADRLDCLYYPSGEAMLSDPEIEAVFLCTPTGLHFTQGKAVLNAGKHLWCEKSLTTSSAHSQQLVEMAQEKNLFVGEAYMYKYHQQFRKLKEAVEGMQYGALRRLICRFSIPTLDQPGFRINSNLGASALLDVGSYTFSLAAELFGGCPRFDLAEYRADANHIDQSGFCVLGYEGGGKAILDWSYNSCYINQAELWFENGVVFTDKIFSKSDDYRPVLNIRSAIGAMESIELPAENCYVNMLNEFARCSRESVADDFKTILFTAQLISAFSEKVGMKEIGWE
jgi:dTDP-3,4-didehydro-2,6-dideoxy-alpha-D-glucose 3-reductase